MSYPIYFPFFLKKKVFFAKKNYIIIRLEIYWSTSVGIGTTLNYLISLSSGGQCDSTRCNTQEVPHYEIIQLDFSLPGSGHRRFLVPPPTKPKIEELHSDAPQNNREKPILSSRKPIENIKQDKKKKENQSEISRYLFVPPYTNHCQIKRSLSCQF